MLRIKIKEALKSRYFNPIEIIKDNLTTDFYRTYLVNRFQDLLESLVDEDIELIPRSVRYFTAVVINLEKKNAFIDFSVGITNNGEVSMQKIYRETNGYFYVLFSKDGSIYYDLDATNLVRTEGLIKLTKILINYDKKQKEIQ